MKPFNEYTDPEIASKELSKYLKDGTLTLFLGAGASIGFGLPNWRELILRMRAKVGLSDLPDKANAQELQKFADDVRDKFDNEKEFILLIQECLYDGISLTDNIFNQKLLIAISALLMGSKRGHVRRVVTLNFDNMLEWFLSIFGFVVNPIHKLPALEGSEDVQIFHPHGFIPHPDTSLLTSDFVILTYTSVIKRLGTPGEIWFETVRNSLRTSYCLFIGMSPATLSDTALAPLFLTVGEESEKEGRFGGFWITTELVDDSKLNEFKRNNIVPVYRNKEEIPNFLLTICQNALEK